MRLTIAVALVALMWPGAGLAQTPEDRIEAAMARAAAAGIPLALLDEKQAEGRAKGVSMDVLADAIERRAAGLERAQQALSDRPDIGSDDLTAGADALESGVSEAVLQAVADLAPRERRAVAIAALDRLVQDGRTPADALERVREALQRGPDALLNLPTPGAGAARVPAGVPAGVPAPGTVPQGARPSGPPSQGAPPSGTPLP